MKKILLLFIGAMLASALLSGCGGKEAATTEEPMAADAEKNAANMQSDAEKATAQAEQKAKELAEEAEKEAKKAMQELNK